MCEGAVSLPEDTLRVSVVSGDTGGFIMWPSHLLQITEPEEV